MLLVVGTVHILGSYSRQFMNVYEVRTRLQDKRHVSRKEECERCAQGGYICGIGTGVVGAATDGSGAIPESTGTASSATRGVDEVG